MSFQEHLRNDARLRILQTLRDQRDHRIGDGMLLYALDAAGHSRSRDWVRTQMRDLVELGAVVVVTDTAAVLVVELTPAGLDHVTKRGTIEGIKRPEVGEK